MHYSTPTENSTTLTREVTISSAIADLSGPTAEYYAIRYFDSKQHKGKYAGSGWAECSLSELAEILNKKPATVRKNLYQGLHSGFFWNVTIKGDYVRIRYKAEARIAFEKGLEHLGSFGRVTLDLLNHIRIVATEVQVKANQKSSIRAAKKSASNEVDESGQEDQQKVFVSPDVIFPVSKKKQCQNLGAETHIVYKGPRCIFTDKQFLPYGSKQEAIAEKLHRSERGIRARLSRSRFESIGRPIVKAQFAHSVDLSPQNWDEIVEDVEMMGDTELAKELCRNYSFGKATFRLSCNVYDLPHVQLLKQRWKKSKLIRWIKERLEENPEPEIESCPPTGPIMSLPLNEDRPDPDLEYGEHKSTKAQIVTENPSTQVDFAELPEPLQIDDSSDVSRFDAERTEEVDPDIKNVRLDSTYAIAAPELKPSTIVEQPVKLKKGDRVKIVFPGTSFDGMITKIKRQQKDELGRPCYMLDFKLGGRFHALPSVMLEYIPPIPKPALKTRDRVSASAAPIPTSTPTRPASTPPAQTPAPVSEPTPTAVMVEPRIFKPLIKKLGLPLWLDALEGGVHRIKQEEIGRKWKTFLAAISDEKLTHHYSGG